MNETFNIENIAGFSLLSLSKFNVILGKNGCGKSHVLKRLEQHLRGQPGYGKVRYVSPERGGVVKYDAGIDQTIGSNPNWLIDNRRTNQSQNFRQQSAALFRRLEMIILREIEVEHIKDGYQPISFAKTVTQINGLLDRVRLERDQESGFKLLDKETNAETSADTISSGEAELISLGIEVLSFVKEAVAGSRNVIFIDEPDVHLHPDLQHRLALFIIDVCNDTEVTVVLATHSTAILAGLAESPNCRVAFMKRNDAALTFQAVSEVDKVVLPIFGAHPLSNVFNQAPVLLVEGEDDERVWQQAVRSAERKIRVYPCPVDSIDQLSLYETEVNKIVGAVYDTPKAYSLRDRDLAPELIDDVGAVIRMRLNCRAAENLMLSDDVLLKAGTTWPDLQSNIALWIGANPKHKYYAEMKAFSDGGFDRKSFDLKDIRNIILGLFSNKPWEVLVGQSIAELSKNPVPLAENSIRDYLGVKVCTELLKLA